MSCGSYCSVALPNGAVGWSAVLNMAFSGHMHLLFLMFEAVHL